MGHVRGVCHEVEMRQPTQVQSDAWDRHIVSAHGKLVFIALNTRELFCLKSEQLWNTWTHSDIL